MGGPISASNADVAAATQAAGEEEGCQFPLSPGQMCGRPVVRSGKPGRPSAYCDLPGHTRAKAFDARQVKGQ